MRERSQDQVQMPTIDTGNEPAQVLDGITPDQRGHDGQHSPFAAGEADGVFGYRFGVDPEPAGLLARPDPGAAPEGEPSIEGPNQQLDAGLLGEVPPRPGPR